MTTIKDVAKAAGVSPTTVSLIINGKAKERRISDETSDLVYKVMDELGYRPNMSARRLRADVGIRPTIAFFWPADFRYNILGSFIMHFQEAIEELQFDCEIVIRNYRNGQLEKSAEPILKNSYDGVIIGAMSMEDLAYMESIETRTPVVLLNRQSEKYSTVGSDNEKIGMQVAKMMRLKGYTEAAVLASASPWLATGARTQAFFTACHTLGISVRENWVLHGENTVAGGVKAAEDYCRLSDAPKAILCDSDSMALGALYTFHHHGLKLPKDVELIAIQLLEDSYAKYAVPSITTIAMPNKKIATEALSLLQKLVQTPRQPALHVTVEPKVVIRESFPFEGSLE